MRAVVQRVSEARVEVEGEIVGAIGQGLLAFVGAGKGDSEADAIWLVDKIVSLRVFEDEAGKMSRSLLEIDGGLLIVSQFTLYGDVSRGRRPSFDSAMPPGDAERLYEHFVKLARQKMQKIATGRFRADMRVLADNDGPVTIWIESPAKAPSKSL